MSEVALQPPPTQPKKLRRRTGERRTSLFANGEPWIWLCGGSLAICVAMIVGLLSLVLWQGTTTFWPGALVEVTTHGGKRWLGEVAANEHYRPEAQAFDVVPEEFRAKAREVVEADEGLARRRMLRTENFELTGTHYTWVSDFEISSEKLPDWALVVERIEGGRFYGEPRSFRIDGQELASTPEEAWALYEVHHDSVRERFRRRNEIKKHDIGAVNARDEAARLAARAAELEHGRGTSEHLAAEEAARRVQAECEVEYTRFTREIEALDRENDRYQLRLTTADGQEQELGLSEIVLAHAPNRLSWTERFGVWAARTSEFLFDEPREANSEGGVWPAIFGTVAMTLIMTIFVVPFGVLAALYLREYAKPGPLVSLVRIAVNNLAGVPSIVFGVFGLGFFCYIVGASLDQLLYAEKLPTPTFGTGGILWASLTLALLTLPVVIVPTEEALAAVPSSMREGSYACGATKWQTIQRIVLPRALPGIMTGMVLAIARGAGEVAPLMLVGAVKLAPALPLDAQAPFIHPERSFMHLGFHIYDLGFQSQNSEAAKPMVFTTTLLLIAIVVALNVLAMWVRARLRRRFSGGHV